MSTQRADLRLVDFREPIGREQAGRRPALVITDDGMNNGPSGLIIVIPITTVRRGLPSHIELDNPTTGLSEMSYAKCEDVKSVSERRLITRLGTALLPALLQVERSLRFLLRL